MNFYTSHQCEGLCEEHSNLVQECLIKGPNIKKKVNYCEIAISEYRSKGFDVAVIDQTQAVIDLLSTAEAMMEPPQVSIIF